MVNTRPKPEEVVSKFGKVEAFMGKGCPVLMRSDRLVSLNKLIGVEASDLAERVWIH